MQSSYLNYSLRNIISNPGEFQSIMEDLNSKYNNSMWKNFTTVLPASRSKNFSTIVEATNIIVKASFVGPKGEKPLRSFEGGETYGDSIHKIGHGFMVTEEDIDKINEMNLVNPDIGYRIARDYFNKAQSIIGGFHAAWNSWIYEALSRQQISLYSEGVLAYTADLRTPAANKFVAKGTANWFDVDPTKFNIADDLQRMDKYATDYLNMPSNRVFVCSKALLDKIIVDSKILSSIRGSLAVVNPDTAIVNPNYVRSAISTAFDIPPIRAIDEKSRKEVDGIPQSDSASFDTNYISLIPVGQLFDMHNSLPNYVIDDNPGTYKTLLEGGLIGAIQEYTSNPYSVKTSMESWTFPAFKNPKWIVSLNSASHSSTGLPD